MTLFLEAGNSRLKISDGEKFCSLAYDTIDLSGFEDVLDLEQSNPSMVFCCVASRLSSISNVLAGIEKELNSHIKEVWHLEKSPQVFHSSSLVWKNGYTQASQLGVDRFLAMVGLIDEAMKASLFEQIKTSHTTRLGILSLGSVWAFDAMVMNSQGDKLKATHQGGSLWLSPYFYQLQMDQLIQTKPQKSLQSNNTTLKENLYKDGTLLRQTHLAKTLPYQYSSLTWAQSHLKGMDAWGLTGGGLTAFKDLEKGLEEGLEKNMNTHLTNDDKGDALPKFSDEYLSLKGLITVWREKTSHLFKVWQR